MKNQTKYVPIQTPFKKLYVLNHLVETKDSASVSTNDKFSKIISKIKSHKQEKGQQLKLITKTSNNEQNQLFKTVGKSTISYQASQQQKTKNFVENQTNQSVINMNESEIKNVQKFEKKNKMTKRRIDDQEIYSKTQQRLFKCGKDLPTMNPQKMQQRIKKALQTQKRLNDQKNLQIIREKSKSLQKTCQKKPKYTKFQPMTRQKYIKEQGIRQ